MDLTLLGRGLVLGFTIAAAVGPITLLCIRRTLGEGRVVGLASGLGVATAGATYGAIAAFGLTAVIDLLVDRGGCWASSATPCCCGSSGRRYEPCRARQPRGPRRGAAA